MDEKAKFPWFHEVDEILATKPVVDPVDVIDLNDAISSDDHLATSLADGSSK